MADTLNEFAPFADDSAALAIAGLTLENSSAEIALSGDISFRRDVRSRKDAELLILHLQKIVAAIGQDAPEVAEAPTAAAAETVANPFG